MGRIIPAFTQFFTDDGVPLADGWLRFLISGSNNTDKNTYADTIYQIPNANPLQLDAAGRCPDIFGVGDYRVVSYTNDPVSGAPGTQVQMFDPVTAQGTAITGGGSGTAFDSWDSSVTYGINSIVERDLRTFRSLIDPNTNLDPLLETYAWEQVDFIRYYNETVTYSNVMFVYYNGELYRSIQNLNQNNTPSISPLFWRPIASGYYGFVNSVSNYPITTSDRDKIIVLTAAAVADRTFTLPSMSSATDGFKVAAYNISDYNLVIDTSGSDGIWLSPTDSITVAKGAMVEFIYNYATTTWIIIGNVGPTLGGQNIGTVDNPVTTMDVVDIELSGDLSLPDNSNIFLGAGDDLAIYFDGSSAIFDTAGSVPIDFQINSSSVFTINQTSIEAKQDLTFTGAINPQIIFDSGVGTDMSFYIDSSGFVVDSNGALTLNSNFGASSAINFQVAGIDQWTIDFGGDLLSPGGLVRNIGDASAGRVGSIYCQNIFQADSQVHYFGASNDMNVQFDGTRGLITCAGNLRLTTSTANSIDFYTNNSVRWSINSSGNLLPAAVSTPDIGDASLQRVGDIYCTAISATGNISQGDNDIHYFGGSNDLGIYYSGVSGRIDCNSGPLRISTLSASQINFYTNSTNNWNISLVGEFYPAADNTYDIGTLAQAPRTIFYHTLTPVSDKRLKTNIVKSNLGLDFISNLNPVSFKLKKHLEGQTRYGLIAQEVNKLIELSDFCGLHYNTDEDIWGLDYTQFISPIIKAIQELKEIVDDQAQKLGDISIQQPDNR